MKHERHTNETMKFYLRASFVSLSAALIFLLSLFRLVFLAMQKERMRGKMTFDELLTPVSGPPANPSRHTPRSLRDGRRGQQERVAADRQ